jgi:hypothetical protein
MNINVDDLFVRVPLASVGVFIDFTDLSEVI